MAPADAGLLRIEVVYCPAPGQADLVQLQLQAGATLADALQASGLLQRHSLEAPGCTTAGVWGRVQEPGVLLRDRDRVEIYRPLQVDPKEARRQRYRDQRLGSRR
jgi:putative ubiquitin-RnfH superfamily antitoxin RatB of RatAB toxin-antitoxin module